MLIATTARKESILSAVLEDTDFAVRVIDVDLSEEVERNYAAYAVEVIENRAIPDVRDGLKPVQRRILSLMHDEGITSKKKTVKSARVVGDVMGHLHPHGDASIYDALVRIAQLHTFSVPLIYGHGNFGNPQTPAAAHRYTECRLSEAGELMTSELSENLVPTKPTEIAQDDSDTEYTVLPAQFPNLLVNGSSGLAVTMSTNIPPHNFVEVVNATLYQLEHQEEWEAVAKAHKEGDDEASLAATGALVDNLMDFLPAPDFPTGGEVVGAKEGAREAFTTGNGRVLIRSKYRIKELKGGKHAIVFYELPYGVDPTLIIEKLTDAERTFLSSTRDNKATNGKTRVEGFMIDGLLAIDDFTDQEGMRIEVTVDAKTNPHVVAAELLEKTNLQISFSYNMNALVNGSPRILTLPEVLQNFINFRRDLVKRRLKNEQETRSERLHLVSGLLAVVGDIDKAIEIIRQSEDQAEAQRELCNFFDIDTVQAKYVLDMPLKRLTKYDSLDLVKEGADIEARLNEVAEILADRERQFAIMGQELRDVLSWGKKRGLHVRRSTLADMSVKEYKEAHVSALNTSREVADEPVTLYLSPKMKVYRAACPHISKVDTSTRSAVLLLAKNGQAWRTEVTELPSGTSVAHDNIVALLPSDRSVAIATKNGIVYAVEANWPTRTDEFVAMNIAPDDEIIGAYPIPESGSYAFLSSDSSLLTFDISKVAIKATVGGKGMAGINLGAGERVLAFAVVSDNAMVATSTGMTVKATPLSAFPAKGRATGGVRAHRFLKGETTLVAGAIGNYLVYLDANGPVDTSDVSGGRADSGAKVPSVVSILSTR